MHNLKKQARERQESGDWASARQLWEDFHQSSPQAADLQSWTGHARCCFLLRDFNSAIASANNALGIKPKHTPALTLKAKIATALEDWPNAVQLWNDVLQSAGNPKIIGTAKTTLARALTELGEFEIAAQTLDELVQNPDTEATALEMRAKLAEKQKDSSQAKIYWEKLAETSPETANKSAAYLKFVGGLDTEENARFSLVDLDGADANSASDILNYLNSRVTKGEYQDAAEKVAKKFPDVPSFEAGFLSARIGNISSQSELDDTLTRAAEFADKFPAHPRAWRLLSEANVAAGNKAIVDEILDKQRAVSSQSQSSLLLESWSHAQAGNHDTAIELAKMANAMRYNRAEDTSHIKLKLLNNEPSAPFKDKILLFASFQNEREFAPWFLDYYRQIGVDWFFIVDNQSTDGTAEFLAAQKDVTAFSSADVFLRVASGMCWINALINTYGDDNWCVFVDADEQLIVPEMESTGLRGFLDGMSERGETALPAFMLDTYFRNADGVADFKAGDDPLALSNLIDPEHFFTQTTSFCHTRVRGGVRSRLFETREVLEKAPIIRGGGGRMFQDNHSINHAKVSAQSAVLLHHKVLRDALDVLTSEPNTPSRIEERRALCRVRHAKYRSAGYYESEDGFPIGDNAFEYAHSSQLLDLGLMGSRSNLMRKEH